jgi:hypothetical protein
MVFILKRIKKEVFLETNNCQRKGWLLRNEKGLADLSLAEKFRMEEGIAIGEKARELFPGGVLVHERSIDDAARKTSELLADPSVRIIFESSFVHNEYATKADVLIRSGDSWELIEVKSKTTRKRPKSELSELIDDIAYTALITVKNGVELSNMRLMLVSEKFELGIEISRLFETFDYTREVKNRITEFEKLLEPYAEVTSQSKEPDFRIINECKKCDFFDHCIPASEECTIFDIPRIQEKQLLELYAKKIFHVKDIPQSFTLTPTQKIPVECMRSGEIIVDTGLGAELKKVKWPAHYLDFETTQTAYPLYPNVAPQEKIPTQYSIHICSECGKILDHKEFLADPTRDCRRELAVKLINDLEGQGTILAYYSTFEKKIIEGLITRYPDLEEPLKSIISRLLDLMECSKCVNHPKFKGSNSIKDVLPALVPGMSYKGMSIANGEDASVIFAYMALGKFTPEECTRIREDMLRYCELDTFAMVKIHDVF